MSIIYLDNAASTQIDPTVLAAMENCNQYYGNASCKHSMGRKSKELIERAREQVANSIGAKPHEVIFTSGGTEANNLAIKGYVQANEHNGYHIITVCTEHVSVLNPLKSLEYDGYEVTYLSVDKDGRIDPFQVYLAIRSNTILISVMFANNEIGTIQPIAKIGAIAKKYNICFHTDSTQAMNYCDIDVNKLNIDMMSLSGHKIYAPNGVGVLYVKEHINLIPLFHGGGQEYNLKSGTENVQGIVGIGKAVELISSDTARLTALKQQLIDGITANISNIRINSPTENSLPSIVNVSFAGVSGKILAEMLDDRGICVSSGSACSTNSTKASHVLRAIGVPDRLAKNSIRFSFGKYNTADEIPIVINALTECVDILRNKEL